MDRKKLTKRISLSFLGLMSVTTISSVAINFSNNSPSNNYSISQSETQQLTNAIKSTASLNDLKESDIYNDYMTESGYIALDTTTATITFKNYFGLEVWTFDINKNSADIFGTSTLLKEIKVRIIENLNTVLVYGLTSSNLSYIFQLSLDDGSIYQSNGKKVLLSNSSDANAIISNLNVINVIENSSKVILLPKITAGYYDDTNPLRFSFSEVNLLDWSVENSTDYTYSAGSSTTLKNSFHEIIGVVKLYSTSNSVKNYAFNFSGFQVKQSGSSAEVTAQIFTGWYRGQTKNQLNRASYPMTSKTTVNKGNYDETLTYLSNDIFPSLDFLTITDYSTNYAEILSALKWTQNSTFAVTNTNFLASQIYGDGVPTTDQTLNVFKYSLVKTSSVNTGGTTSGIIQFITTKRGGSISKWGLVVNTTNTKQIALLPINIAAGTASGNYLININLNSGVWSTIDTSETNPNYSVFFIPDSTYTASTNLQGLVQTSDTSGANVSTSSFSFLNASTNIEVNTNYETYDYQFTDDQLQKSFKDNLTDANIKDKVFEAASSIQSSSGAKLQVTNKDISKLTYNSSTKTLSGEITFSIPGWWNSANTSQTTSVTRNIHIYNDDPSTPGGGGNNNNGGGNNGGNNNGNGGTNNILPPTTIFDNQILGIGLIVSFSLVASGIMLLGVKGLSNKVQNHKIKKKNNDDDDDFDDED